MSNREREIKMFGETIETMRAMAGPTKLDDPTELILYAMGILSDAQVVLTHDSREGANRFINKAKYFIAEAHRILREREKRS